MQSIAGVAASVYAAIAFLFAVEVLTVHAAETAPPDGVVIVHSNQRPVPATAIIDDTLRRVVAENLGRPVEFYSEFLDSERFSTPEYAEAAAALLRRKYIDRNIKIFVAIVPQALQFVRDHREQILPGIPVVYISLPMDALPKEGLPPDFVGTTIDLDPTATLALALRLQPRKSRA